MKNRIEIKQEAKAILRTAQVNPLLMTAVVLVIGYMLDRIVALVEIGRLFPSPDYLLTYWQAVATGDTDALLALASSLPESTLMGTFFSILVALFMSVLMAGYAVYCMGIRQGVEMPWSSLLEGLGVAGKVIWCIILMAIKIFLWALLLWIPGIIAFYRYRFAIYNLLTDDSLSASAAIRLSCEQTRGMKGQLFVLDLSFFGWRLLSLLTFNILSLWLTPYVNLCDLGYFEEGQRKLGRSPYGGEFHQNTPSPDDPPSWEL